jgi:protein import protein ZIM17
MMMYTCAVDNCGTKQARTFSKDSYQNGVVLLRCEGCDKLHLIADNLGWFENDGVNKGNKINIETIMAEKGEKV